MSTTRKVIDCRPCQLSSDRLAARCTCLPRARCTASPKALLGARFLHLRAQLLFHEGAESPNLAFLKRNAGCHCVSPALDDDIFCNGGAHCMAEIDIRNRSAGAGALGAVKSNGEARAVELLF